MNILSCMLHLQKRFEAITVILTLPTKFFIVSCLCQLVCSDKTQFSCENLCGNLLSCDNHYCTKTCHAVENLLATPVQIERSESCEECHLPCQKVVTLYFLLATVLFSFSFILWSFCLFNPLKAGKLPSYFECFHSGEEAHMLSSLPPAMSSWRMLPLQSACKTIMSLWGTGSCFWVHILQWIVWKGAGYCSLMWWALP